MPLRPPGAFNSQFMQNTESFPFLANTLLLIMYMYSILYKANQEKNKHCHYTKFNSEKLSELFEGVVRI